MAVRDLQSNIKELLARNVAAISTNTTSAGNIIDTQGYAGVMFTLFSGAYTDGTYTPLLEESDDSGLSASNAVADADLLPAGTGQEASAALTAANTISKIGYRGTKRYVRLSIVSTVVTTGATLGAVAILGQPSNAPIA